MAARFMGRGVLVPEMTLLVVRRDGTSPTPSMDDSLGEEMALRGLLLPFLGLVT